MENLKIGVIGLGLIGGSVLKRLFSLGFYTIAVSASSYEAAKSFANVSSSDINVLKDADVVFVCSPMSKTLSVLDSLEGIVAENTIVTDVCSLKEFVTAKKRPYEFVGSHPMAGTEHSGFEHSFAELFEGAKWVLTEKNKTLESLILEMGAKPLVMSAKDHDLAAAKISHLSMLLAQGLFMTGYEDERARKIASSGFCDMTRLAMTSPVLCEDMFSLNLENIEKALGLMTEHLAHLKKLSANERIEAFKENAQKRAKMYENKRNIL